jgi:hypothetical protein
MCTQTRLAVALVARDMRSWPLAWAPMRLRPRMVAGPWVRAARLVATTTWMLHALPLTALLRDAGVPAWLAF